MSNLNLIIEERAADIGGFLVGRLLPFIQKRMIGPFCFIDHLGPVKMDERKNMDIRPHPHIGLSTLTYLFEGSIMHRDSIGNTMEITPGAVNWMTAGKGIVHSERTPDYLRQKDKTLHGLQIWVALPKDLEAMDPQFTHVEKDALPTWTENGVDFKLIAGKAFGKESPIPIFSPLYMIEIKTKSAQILNLGEQLFGESGLYILEGSIESEGQIFGSRQLLVAKNTKLCEFSIQENSTIYLFGGEAFPEERFIDWNFVSTSKETLKEAKQRWKDQKFDKIVGDDIEFVPYPDYKIPKK